MALFAEIQKNNYGIGVQNIIFRMKDFVLNIILRMMAICDEHYSQNDGYL
jgi:hypothetical protein